MNRKVIFADDPEMLHRLAIRDMQKAFRELMIPKGDKGDQGESGRDGIDGKDGEDGENGKDGINGLDGRNGIDGINGQIGKNGINGKDGKDAESIDIEALFDEFIDRIRKKKLIDISHLRNADSFIFNGTKYKTHELMHGGGSSGATQTVATTDISSQFNGVATTFTIPAYSSILQFTITGYPPEGALRPTVDFTTPTNTTVTISTPAPVAGTTGIIIYVAA